jgi:alpha-mannosidase
LFANNFGTNFAVSQAGEFVFRHVIGSGPSRAGVAATDFGWRAVLPLQAIFTKHARPRPLPATDSFLSIDPAEVVLLACKRADAGAGIVLRLWNPTAQAVAATLRLAFMELAAVQPLNLGEEPAGEPLAHTAREFAVRLAPQQVLSLRLDAAAPAVGQGGSGGHGPARGGGTDTGLAPAEAQG